MPITFKSKYSPDILMLENVGLELIRLMGHSGTVPGSLATQDIASALQALKTAISSGPVQALAADRSKSQDDDGHEPAISAAHRALPLINMLETAQREGEHVIWDH